MSETVIIQSLSQAEEQLKKAERSGTRLILQSPPHAIYYAGSLYYLNIFKQAQAAYPQARAVFVFDCSDAWAEAIAAMHDGHKMIKSSAKAEIMVKLKYIAREYGVNFVENDA